jgi:hypothetical protein
MTAQPEDELNNPLDCLAGHIVTRIGLYFSSLFRKQINLREHADALQIQRKSPGYLPINYIYVSQKIIVAVRVE